MNYKKLLIAAIISNGGKIIISDSAINLLNKEKHPLWKYSDGAKKCVVLTTDRQSVIRNCSTCLRVGCGNSRFACDFPDYLKWVNKDEKECATTFPLLLHKYDMAQTDLAEHIEQYAAAFLKETKLNPSECHLVVVQCGNNPLMMTYKYEKTKPKVV